MFAVSEIRLSLGEDLGKRTRVMDISARIDEERRRRHRSIRNIVTKIWCDWYAPVPLELCPDGEGPRSPQVPLDDPI